MSGGIVSSVIASLAQKQVHGIDDTYSIGFTEKKNDDTKVAGILGTNHHELYCTQNDTLELIQKIPDAYAKLFANNSQIPMMLLGRMIREHVAVELSRDGGDELFIGYPTYMSNKKLLLRP